MPSEPLPIEKAPRGQLALRRIIDAAGRAGDLAERHYLELKAPSDLTDRVEKAKIAKFILGAANRMPQTAAKAFEGCALMLIGIGPDGVIGIPPIEPMEISKYVQKFLGAEGPDWDVVLVDVEDGNVVVAIVVEPPKYGQPPFVCRANGDKLQDGRIYIRADGATREANSAELDQLMSRGRAHGPDQVRIDVSIPTPVQPVCVDQAQTQEWFIAEATSLLLARLEPTGSQGPGGLFAARATAIMEQSFAKQESRTPDEYRQEIESWAAQCREHWDQGVVNYLGQVIAPASICLRNLSEKYLTNVQVKVTLDPRVVPIEARSMVRNPTWSSLRLPDLPRPWGPQPYSAITPAISQHVLDLSEARLPSINDLEWDDDGEKLTLTASVGDLRPLGQVSVGLEEVCLVCQVTDVGEPMMGTWTLTAYGFDHVFTGDLAVAVQAPLEVTDGLRKVLARRLVREGGDTSGL